MSVKWSKEEEEYLKEIIEGRTVAEIQKLLHEKFGVTRTKDAVRSRAYRLGIKSGVVTKFQEGKKYPFQNISPMGSERTNTGGYLEVKVSDTIGGGKGNWVKKHVLLWERYHGRKLPDGYVVLFANHDIYDFSRNNLVAVERALIPRINSGPEYYDKDSLLLCVDLAMLARARYQSGTRRRQCAACGCTFQPEHLHQARCRACIDNKVPGKRKRKHEQ